MAPLPETTGRAETPSYLRRLRIVDQLPQRVRLDEAIEFLVINLNGVVERRASKPVPPFREAVYTYAPQSVTTFDAVR